MGRVLMAWAAAIVLPLGACGSAMAAGAPIVTLKRDAAIGAKYKTLGPRKCAQPAKSGDDLSAADARALVICFIEGEFGSSQLALVTDVSIQVAPARPYIHINDSYDQVDPRRPVHDIRGTLVYYGCSVPSEYTLRIYNGFPCRSEPYAHGTGTCYHDSFGEWRCVFHDFTAKTDDLKPTNPPTRE